MSRILYFETEQVRDDLFMEVLSLQGFSNERLNQYEVLNKLGEGAFGSVFKARHKLSKARYAIKLVNKQAINRTYGKKVNLFCEI